MRDFSVRISILFTPRITLVLWLMLLASGGVSPGIIDQVMVFVIVLFVVVTVIFFCFRLCICFSVVLFAAGQELCRV